MITAEEKTRERFPDRNNRDNPDKQNHRNNRQQERKHGPDNTVAVTDKSRKFSKPRRYDDIENMHCILHPKGNHTIRNCYCWCKKWICKHKGLIPESISKACQSIWPVNRQGWRYEHFGPDNSNTPGSHGQEVLTQNSRIAEGRTEAMQLAESMRTRKKEKYANWRSRRKVSRCK